MTEYDVASVTIGDPGADGDLSIAKWMAGNWNGVAGRPDFVIDNYNL